MDADLANLHNARDKLIRGFRNISSMDGISIEYISDIKTLDLCSRLYDASIDARRINIDYNPQSQLALDSFIKTFDSELGSARLLTVFVNDAGLDVQRLWAISKGWLYDQVDEDSVLFA